MLTQAVILAGGKGERLRARSNGLPKPLVPVEGRPILEWQLDMLARENIRRVIVLAGFGAAQIRSFLSTRADLDVTVIEDGTPRGTAGAVLHAWDSLDSEFLVLYGDTVLDIDLVRFWSWHSDRTDGAATLLIHPNDHPNDSDLVEIDADCRVVQFLSKRRDADLFPRNLVNAALYIVRKQALLSWRNEPIPLDFGKDLFPAMLSSRQSLYAYLSSEYIKDAGTPDRLDQVERDLRAHKPQRWNLRNKRPAVFLDRDGTINVNHDHINKPELIQLTPNAGSAVKRINDSGLLAVLVTNQPVIARGECSVTDLERIHGRLESLLGESSAHLDRIYYCPHHPDAGFPGERPELKFKCDCRKPETQMVRQAVTDMNINCSDSWVVGDSTSDFLLSRRAGLRSVGVATGLGGMDGKYPVEPDYWAKDLSAAVSFILDDYPSFARDLQPIASAIGKQRLVLIGGLARSGKSSVASCLADQLRQAGRITHIVSLDRWIRPSSERGEGVLGRYDMKKIQDFLATVSEIKTESVEVELPFYFRFDRRAMERAQTLTVSNTDTIIVEGTIALACNTDSESTRIYVQTDDKSRHNRFMELQRTRGHSEIDAQSEWEKRENDETPVVRGLQERADFLVTLNKSYSAAVNSR